MAVTKDEILAAARAMTPAQRYDLIEDLRQILDDDELTPQQLVEIRRRIDASNAREEKSMPVDEVVAELREELRRHRRRRAS